MSKEIKKVVRDGKVAILYSPGFGAGWYTWNRLHRQLIFSPEIVALVEADRRDEITEKFCESLLGLPKNEIYAGGARKLEIKWIQEGEQFEITEYDGSETVSLVLRENYLIA